MNASRRVFGKELREMLRDKRVVQSALFGPVFLVFLFVLLFGFLQQTIEKKKQGQKIHVVKVSPEPSLLGILRKEGKANIVFVDSVEVGEELVKKGDANIVLHFPSSFDADLITKSQAGFDVIFDGDQPSSGIAVNFLERATMEEGHKLAKSKLKDAGLPETLLEPIKVNPKPVKREGTGMGGFMAGMMPYLIVIWAFYGGFSQAADLVAGEKERSTLETLFVLPISRLKIALGKFYALAALCFVSSMSSLVAVVVAANLPLKMAKGLFEGGVHVTLPGVLSILSVVIPLSAMFAGILLAISTYARNTRECQGHLTIVSFIVIMPAMFSQFIGYTDYAKATWVSLVPILNSASVLRSAMLGNFEAQPFLITLGVNLLLAFIAIRLVVRMFGTERVLWRI